MTPAELAPILEAHRKWRRGEDGGIRAALARADLTGAALTGAALTGAALARADLTGANLTGADLTGANLTDADLTGADLTGADLTGANLTDADLTRANLTEIRDDLIKVLEAAPVEVPGLLAALRAGKVDGSTYSGDCACLVGTLANVRGAMTGFACDYTELGVKPNSERPAERWFLAILEDDTPETNQVAKITEGWIVDWLAAQPAPVAPAAPSAQAGV